ncbi:MAG: 3-deoxy-D-manno-octulosonic acid transferase [Lentisphaeria bacterium]|jgi:3-deoxy-D-manno-octulosonic-acid transferase
MLFLYNILLPLVFLVYLPAFAWRQLRRGNFLPRCGERFGFYGNAKLAALKRLKAPVWIHAVSVGEAVAALSFIRHWQALHPETDFVLSTTTTTGQATAQARLPARAELIYCPFDLPFAVNRALRAIRPSMLAIFEVEIWPNLITRAARYGAKVVLANGRVSDRSAKGYARHRWFFAPIFRRFALFCMQSDEDAARIRAVVGDAVPIRSCNTMKFDQIPDADAQDKAAVLADVFGPGPRLTLTAGSTHAGEEELVATVFKRLRETYRTLRLVLVPRHVERTAEVEAVLRKLGLTWRLLKPGASGQVYEEPVEVLLVNTTGELMAFYAAADVAYVGKSLAGNHGGHNIIEPAIFGKPILHGAHMENFRLVTAIFRKAAAAAEVPDDATLEPALKLLLDKPALRQELGRKARQVVEANRGAIARTIAALRELRGQG